MTTYNLQFERYNNYLTYIIVSHTGIWYNAFWSFARCRDLERVVYCVWYVVTSYTTMLLQRMILQMFYCVHCAGD